jgi:DNA-binding NtrC family response regulator
VRVPSLRERPEDIEALVEYFLQTLRVKIPSPLRRFDAAAAARLRAYAWPGNVRQLRNVIERALVFAKGPVGGLDLLPPELLRPAEEPPPSPAAESPAGEEPPLPLAEMERRHILRALELCGGNKQQAAALLGISRSTLYEKLRELKK